MEWKLYKHNKLIVHQASIITVRTNILAYNLVSSYKVMEIPLSMYPRFP